MVDSAVPLKRETRFLVVVIALVVLATLVILRTGWHNKRVAESSTLAQRVEAFRQAHPPANLPAPLPDCRLLPGYTLLTLAPTKPDHRVILRWNASIPDEKHPEAAGYCVYRREKGKNPQKKLINRHAFPKTACTDDWVENDHKYIYAVRAANKDGNPSPESNEARADIPKTKPKPHPEGWPPLCRSDNPQ
jgi:hypothetical protein